HPDTNAQNVSIMDVVDQAQGSLISLISSYGYKNAASDDVYGDYPEMLHQLDLLAYEFSQAFNLVHQEGYNLAGDSGEDFFVNLTDVAGAARQVTVFDEILQDPSLIAAGYPAGGEAHAGNGENASRLADMFDASIPGLEDRSPREFLQSMISKLGINAQEA